MKNKGLLIAALSGFFCVALGAFAAHGLTKILEPKALAWIDTGLKYQMFHTLALLAVSLLQIPFSSVEKSSLSSTALYPSVLYPIALAFVSYCWVGGILLFSGSLYALAFGASKVVAWITPVGGTLFLIGWGILIHYSLKKSVSPAKSEK